MSDLDIMRGVEKPLNTRGYPEEGRNTQDGICPICKNEIANITPIYRKLTGCKNCGTVIDWRNPTNDKHSDGTSRQKLKNKARDRLLEIKRLEGLVSVLDSDRDHWKARAMSAENRLIDIGDEYQ